MKKIFLLLGLLFSISLFAQEQGSIRGIVLDQEMANEPMLFANLELKGTSLTTQSNLFGKFEITEIEPGNYIVEISQAGYQTVEIPIEVKANEVKTIQKSMVAEMISPEELVLITEDKKEEVDLTSSLTTSEKD